MGKVRSAMLALLVLALATTMLRAQPVEILGAHDLIILDVNDKLSSIEPDENINTGSIIKAPSVQAQCDGMVDKQGKCRPFFKG